MPPNKIAKIITSIFIVVIVSYILLFFLNKKMVNILNKKTATCLCKCIMNLKIDKNINQLLIEESSEIKNNNVKVTLIFNHNDIFSNKNNNITIAYCIFNINYVNNEVWLKSFYYQDLKNNLYMYNNVNIKIKNIKTCELK